MVAFVLSVEEANTRSWCQWQKSGLLSLWTVVPLGQYLIHEPKENGSNFAIVLWKSEELVRGIVYFHQSRRARQSRRAEECRVTLVR